ncbi:PepSY domain-containing protein [Streptomyces sp. BA2]|uniref:PepSY domain-containing protein n=1 Tax=Streptomyces sp. BA2 TaxID=436595 RepID=UPI001326A638|nr:PepSY domain-containing protein [Streptomyces sp. BA2]MWA13216.1 peptidase M4 [Streptomyces sp. BA2]
MRFEPRHSKSGAPRARHLRLVGAVCALVASAALVTGCGDDNGKSSAEATSKAAKSVPKEAPTQSPTGSASLTQDQQERKALLATTKVTYDKAATTAVGKVSGGKLTDLDLKGVDDDSDDTDADDASGSPSPSPSPSPSGSAGAPQWVAEVAEKDGTVHNVRIDAVSGKVISSAPDNDQDADDKKETADWISRAKQTPEQAAKTATAKKKGTVTSIGLDDDDNKALVWSVDVVTDDWNKTDFEIDAVKGNITREHVDRD